MRIELRNDSVVIDGYVKELCGDIRKEYAIDKEEYEESLLDTYCTIGSNQCFGTGMAGKLQWSHAAGLLLECIRGCTMESS